MKNKIQSDIEFQVLEKYAYAKNKRDLLWEKLNKNFSLIQKGETILEFQDEWNEFSIAEFECRSEFDNLQTLAKTIST